jgi:hypothetical protein
MTDALVRFTQGLIVWGSNDVIRKFGTFRNVSTKDPDAAALAKSLEDVLLSIRSDLGHSSSGLKRNDLLRLLITDIESITGVGARPKQ